MRGLLQNTLVGLAGITTQRVLAFVTTLVLARGLGREGFGIYSFVGVYVFFFGFFGDLGIERVVTRELSSQPQQAGRLLGNAIILKLALSAVVVPAAWVVAWFWDMPGEARACVFLAALAFPLSIESVLRSYFQSQFAVKYTYMVTLPSGALALALAALCVLLRLPVHYVFGAALVNGALALAGLLFMTTRRVRLSLQPDPRLLRLLLRDASEVGLFVLLIMLSMRLDQLLLFQLRGATEVGRYAVGVRAAEGLSILPEAIMLTVFPMLGATQHSAPERFRAVYTLSFKYLSAIILPVALLLTLLRDALVSLVFGASYADSALPLAILGWGMFFAYNGAVYLNLFIIQHRQRAVVMVSVVGVTVNIVANLLLIPPYGATGAALAMVIGNVASFGAFAVVPQTAPFMWVCVTAAARPLAAVAAAWLVVSVVSLSGVPAALLALAVYAAVMAGARGINFSDVALVRRLLATDRQQTTDNRQQTQRQQTTGSETTDSKSTDCT